MEQERMFTLNMEVRPLKKGKPASPAAGQETRMFHYQKLDEAFLQLYTIELDRLDSRIARNSELDYCVEKASISRKGSSAPLMFLSHHTYSRMTTRKEWNWPYKEVLAIEKGNNERLLSAELRSIIDEHIPGLAHQNGIALAEYNRTRERLYPADNLLMCRLRKYKGPEAPLLSNYAYNLQFIYPGHKTGKASMPNLVSESTPLNDLAYGMYHLCSLPLRDIGTTHSANIMNWNNKFPLIALSSIQPGSGDSGLYLDFHSEIHRFLAETSVHPAAPLSKDPMALSIKIATYSAAGELIMTPEFTSFRDRLRENYQKKIAPSPAVQNRIIAPEQRHNARRGL